MPDCSFSEKNDEDKSKNNIGMAFLIGSAIPESKPETRTSILYQEISRFFVLNEGVGMIAENTDFDFLRTKFSDAHLSQTYCAYMLSMTSNAVTKEKRYFSNSVNCPVDIEVYEKSGNELVAKIVDNEVVSEIAEKENSVIAYVDGDSKNFILPGDGEYTVNFIGNDNGTMDYIVSEYDSDLGEISRSVFFDVDVSTDNIISTDFTGESIDLKELKLVDQKNNAEILNTSFYNIDYNDTKVTNKIKVDIDIKTKGNGYADESLKACVGDVLSVSAEANEGEEFKGWYIDDELVCSDNVYTMIARENVTLVAKFSNNSFFYSLIGNQYILIGIGAIVFLAISTLVIVKVKKKKAH